jgi:hypothetical protein
MFIHAFAADTKSLKQDVVPSVRIVGDCCELVLVMAAGVLH